MDAARFEDILDYAKTQGRIELTFDDANESDYTIALPLLQARGMKAQFFVVVDRVGQPGFLSCSQVGALLAAGMEIGNHGMRHRRWVGLCDSELREELVEARERLEQLTRTRVQQAACPFGSYNRRVIQALKCAGYKRVYTSDGGFASNGSWVIPRNSACDTWTAESVKAILSAETGWFRRRWCGLKRLLKSWR
jgi:peptidoglycan/xylan/chitin deacetylase (PgdA/CDA1 family)